MLLRPSWLQNLESPVEKCSSASDVISLIMDRIIVNNIRQAESLVNGLIDGINKIIGWIKKLDHVCWEYKTFKRCPEDPEALAAIFGCNPGATEPHKRCYYECASANRTFSIRITRAHNAQDVSVASARGCAGAKNLSVSARPRRTRTTKTSSTRRRRVSSSSSLPTSSATRTSRCRRRSCRPSRTWTPPIRATTRRRRTSATRRSSIR